LISTPSRIPWLRVLVEGVVIVASILLAFGIDAWWDASQEWQEEQEILRGLETEFAALELELEEGAVRYERVARDIELLLDSLPVISDLSLPRLDSAMFNLTYDGTFDPGAGTHTALIASGRLELISDAELRDRLAGWQSAIDEVVDNEIIMRTFVATVLVPAMASKGLQVGRGHSRYFRRWSMGLDSPNVARRRYREAFVDPEVTSLAQYRYAWALGTLGERISTAEAVGEMLTLIRGQIR
jgi:hypothetical protein